MEIHAYLSRKERQLTKSMQPVMSYDDVISAVMKNGVNERFFFKETINVRLKQNSANLGGMFV